MIGFEKKNFVTSIDSLVTALGRLYQNKASESELQ
jgi:hypothetical protein